MTDSIDNKSKEKRDNLDAMLDEAESSLVPVNEFDDDEDAIDRLLMNAGFDADNALIQEEANQDVHVAKDAGLHDELDEFLSFEGFGATINELEKIQADEGERLKQAAGNSSFIPLNDTQDDEDDLDRLLMNAALKADDAPERLSAEDADVLEELDDFSDFSDFNEPEIVPAAEVDDAGQAEGNSATDEFDDFFGLSDDFDESDLIQDDEPETSVSADLVAPALVEASDMDKGDGEVEELDDFSDFSDFNEPEIAPAVAVVEPEQATGNSSVEEADLPDGFFGLDDEVETSASAVADLIAPAVVAAPDAEEDAGTIEALDDFSDFSDFNEPDIIAAGEVEESGQVTENSSAVDDEGLTDAADEFADFDGFGDDFDESDLIQDDEIEASADSVAPSEEPPAVGEPSSNDEDAVDSLLVDAGNDGEVALGQTGENVDERGGDADLSDEVDEFADFDGFGDDFDESDLIQDDEIEASADLAALSEEPSTPVDQPEDAVDSLLVDAGNDGLEQTSEDDLVDEFSGLADDFDASDLIQDDEIEASADLAALSEEPSTPVGQPEDAVDSLLVDAGNDGLEQTSEDDLVDDFSGLSDDFDVSDLIQDDEVETSIAAKDANSFDNLFVDAGFDAADSLEQSAGKKDEFGDDTDLTAIEDFFQLDEVSDSFSEQGEAAQLEGTDKSSVQDDDFLLPDFDITADSEISDAGIKDAGIADVFGDTDFLAAGDVGLAVDPEITELKAGDTKAAAESASEQAADTAVQGVEDVKLSPFGFEKEDMIKQLEDAGNKVKKAKRFSYVAMGVGAVALSAAAGLGVMTYSAKNEVSKLTETVSTLEASLAKSAANNPNKEIDAMRNSVVQLNQQVDGFITELKGNHQSPVDLLTNKVPDIVAKQDMVSKALDMLQVKMGGEGKPSTDTPVAEPPKAEAAHEPAPVKEAKEASAHEHGPAKEETGHEHAPDKELATHESPDPKAGTAHEPPKKGTEHEPVTAKETVAHEQMPAKEATAQEHAPTKERAKHETAPAKVETAPVAEPVKAENQLEPATAKPTTPAKAIVKEEPVNTKQAASGKWGVNLGAFKQEWFAKSKAAEYARQGVFAEVVPVPGKNSMMYRLRVGGFKNKAEANSNTARIKQALNLDSVWVSDN